MEKCLFSKLSRDRKEDFSIYTNIIENEGRKFVVKSASSIKAKKHIQQFLHNCSKLKDIYGNSLNIASCSLINEFSVQIDYVEGETLLERVTKLLQANKKSKAFGYVLRLFEIIKSRSNENFSPCKNFVDVFGCFEYLRPLMGIDSSSFDLHFNNIIINKDEELYFFDYEWDFDCQIPLNYVFFRSIQMLALNEEDTSQLLDIFGIDEGQKNAFCKMEKNFLAYVRTSFVPHTAYDYHQLLGKSCIVHNLNYLDINNPKVFPDYGTGYSESTKKVCADFDFKYGVLNARIVFPNVPQRIRFDPVDGLCCLVSEVKIVANDIVLPITWHNGLDLNGIMLFDTIDSNIYYENTVGAKEFSITARIVAFNDDNLLSALKMLLPLKSDHDNLQIQVVQTYNQYIEIQSQLKSTEKRFSESEKELLESQNRVISAQEEVIRLQDFLGVSQVSLTETQSRIALLELELKRTSEEKAEALYRSRQFQYEMEQLKESYDNIRNAMCWKLTYPLRKLLDLMKSILKKN